ncbi:MAG TPA: cbb3-type cytochrome c oxidase N-terminal domain-containing protein [Mucilaginibacter sp.]|nr:cbb3-type cytochrome c oxidase N-terminal domain-containing protein [Mucilaginibacter sp.]
MKLKQYILTLFLSAGVAPVFAEGNDSLLSGETMNYIGYGTIVAMLLLFIGVMLVLLRTFKTLTRILLGPEALKETEQGKSAAKAQRNAARSSLVTKLLSLKPMSEEGSLIMEGEYDGIRELNNPTPAWFMVLFYITIAFGAGYLLVYHVFKSAPLQYEEYRNDMAAAAKEKAAMLAKSANLVDENTVKLTTDPAVLADGKTVFTTRCSPCHGDHGQGVVGPNLTDDYWLHGNTIKDIFKTIEYGVPSKGMPTWESQLTPVQISDVANYVKSIHGTNPANPKEPQGTKMTEAAPAAPAPKTAMKVK